MQISRKVSLLCCTTMASVFLSLSGTAWAASPGFVHCGQLYEAFRTQEEIENPNCPPPIFLINEMFCNAEPICCDSGGPIHHTLVIPGAQYSPASPGDYPGDFFSPGGGSPVEVDEYGYFIFCIT